MAIIKATNVTKYLATDCQDKITFSLPFMHTANI